MSDLQSELMKTLLTTSDKLVSEKDKLRKALNMLEHIVRMKESTNFLMVESLLLELKENQ